MVKVIYRAPTRVYKAMRSIALFTIGAALVLFAIFFPKTFRGTPIFGISGGGIANADVPSCGSCGDGDGCASCGGDGDGCAGCASDGGSGGAGDGDGGGCDSSGQGGNDGGS